MSDLADKVVLITGTASGQGRAAALAFTAVGARVFGCDLDVVGSEETLRLVREAGGVMKSIHPLDISSETNAVAWAAAAKAEFGGIDVLYNNAGKLVGHSPFGRTTLREWDDCIRYELTTVFVCSKAVWPYFVEQGRGLIINTASIAAHIEPAPFHAPVHGVTKAGAVAFTRMIAHEGAVHNIRSISISPGLVDSAAINASWSDDNLRRKVHAALTEKIPLGRAAQCAEIASVAVFLASDGASYINGADIIVDGGWTGVSYKRVSE